MGIRIAKKEDLKNILILDKEFAKEYKSFEVFQDNAWTDKYGFEYYTNIIDNNENAEIILYELDWKIVWYIEAEYNIIEKEFWNEVFARLHEFYVIISCRNKWIWWKLYTYFQDRAIEKNCTIIRLETNFHNTKWQNFYKNMWFEENAIVFDKKIK